MVTAKERKDALKALTDYTREGTLTDLEALGKWLHDESDRGMVVIVASLTEDLLMDAIRKLLPPIDDQQWTKLTKTGGVLGGWVQRVNFARALGIIDNTDAEELELLGAMRNACAHSRKQINLDTPELKKVMSFFFKIDSEGMLTLHGRQMMRPMFLYLTSALWGSIRKEDTNARAHLFLKLAELAVGKPQASPRKRRKPQSQGGGTAPSH